MFGHIPFLHWVHVWCAACWGDITNRHPHAVRHAEWARDGCEKSSCRWPKTLPGRRGVALFFVDLFDLRNIGSEIWQSSARLLIQSHTFHPRESISKSHVHWGESRWRTSQSQGPIFVPCRVPITFDPSKFLFFLWLKHMFPDPTSIARHKRPRCSPDLHSIWIRYKYV